MASRVAGAAVITLLTIILCACGIAAVRSAPRVRARDERGRFVSDNKATWWRNEAWRRKWTR